MAFCLLACAAPAPSGETPSGETRGFRGVYAVRGERIVAAEHAGRLFVPASVHKLVVAAAALRHLGPEHRITTELRAGGEISSGSLNGDLVLRAAGDPTWSERFFPGEPHAQLAALARQLSGRGIRRVGGDLVVDAGRFPGRPFPTSRPPSEYAYGYAAPTSALAVDENAVQVEIAPGARIGVPGSARLLAGDAAGTPRLVARIRTVPEERHGSGTVDFLPVWEGDTIDPA